MAYIFEKTFSVLLMVSKKYTFENQTLRKILVCDNFLLNKTCISGPLELRRQRGYVPPTTFSLFNVSFFLFLMKVDLAHLHIRFTPLGPTTILHTAMVKGA